MSSAFATKTLVTNSALAWPSYQPHRCKRHFHHRPVTVQRSYLHQPHLSRFKACLIGADMDVAQDLLLVLLQHFQDSLSANVVEKHVPGGVSISHKLGHDLPQGF